MCAHCVAAVRLPTHSVQKRSEKNVKMVEKEALPKRTHSTQKVEKAKSVALNKNEANETKERRKEPMNINGPRKMAESRLEVE